MAFLTKSSSFSQSNSSNLSNSQNSEVVQSKVSSANSAKYSQIAQNDQFPKREQGIIMECVGGLTLTDYTCVIGDLIEPINVLYSSRISNNRVCMYLKNKELVDKITDEYDFLVIKEQQVPVRPLVAKLKKLIISNVAPPIPHYVLENALEAIDIKCHFPISTLKATINKDGYSHVMSSKRITYIDQIDAGKLPEFIKVEYDNISYYVYPSINTSIKCFRCKGEGHISRHCTATPHQVDLQDINAHSEDTSKYANQNKALATDSSLNSAVINCENSLDTPIEENSNAFLTIASAQDKNSMPSPHTGIKRLRTSTVSTISSQNLDDKEKSTDKNAKLKITAKKIKTSTSTKIDITELKNVLKPAESYIIENETKYPINFENLANFLDESYGKSNIREIALRYTPEISLLTNMLHDIHDNIQDKNLRNRINRIIKRLTITNYVTSADESDTSQKQD